MSKITITKLIRCAIFAYIGQLLICHTLPRQLPKATYLYYSFTPIVYTLIALFFYTVNPNEFFSYPLMVAILLYICSILISTYTYKNKKINFINKAFILSIQLYVLCAQLVDLAYYIIYGQQIDDYVFLNITATNTQEAIEYIQSIASWPIILTVIIGLLAIMLILLYLQRRFMHTLNSVPSIKHSKTQIVATIIMLGFLIHYITYVFPISNYCSLHKAQGLVQNFITLNNNLDKNIQTIQIESPPPKKGTIILVLGESANRHHMQAFNPSYAYNTTPWQNTLFNNSNVVAFPNTYSYYPNTIIAATKALLSTSQYNNQPLTDSVSIINMANRAGYKTYWISTQSSGGITDASVSKLAAYSKSLKWVQGYDENVVKELSFINPNEANFVIIHIMGSHGRYEQRYPKSFNNQINSPASAYDTSIAYTDEVLHQIFDYSKKNLNLLAMMYTSDHGENLELGHTTNPVKEDMLYIPLWIYLSPQYTQDNPSALSILRQNQNKYVTNDTLYDTLMGLLQIKANYYTPTGDLFSATYKNEAPISMDGKFHWK